MSGQHETFGRRVIVAVSLILCITLGSAIAKENGGKSISATAATGDYGDAPEGIVAYPPSAVIGQFPTLVGVGPAGWIQHGPSGTLYFGPKVDFESDGNGGHPFGPNSYDQDEGFGDGDAGLLKPRAYSIKNIGGVPTIYPFVTTGLEYMGEACSTVVWGAAIDIDVHNHRTDGQPGYVNVIVDCNQDGKWGGSSLCSGTVVPEHVLVNFPVRAGYDGPLSGLGPVSFQIGPNPGYVWVRFSITERPVQTPWTGDGIFADGETEDYLLRISEAPPTCDWTVDDPHKMHWAQLPDLRTTGIDVNAVGTPLADDFLCTESGPVTDVHFWGSFLHDILPANGVNALTFTVSFYSNQPADNLITWSRPGQLLWSKKINSFTYDASLVADRAPEGWYDPSNKFYEPNNHNRAYQYNICFASDEDRFVQKFGTIYWLVIKVLPETNARYTFGWKTTQQNLQWQDSSAWQHSTYGWLPMTYPDTHLYKGKPMDLAFVITGPPPGNLDFGDAPDPPYPTVLASNGARHTIVPGVYLGKLIFAEPDGQPNATASGDPDDDGVVFLSDVIPGQMATVRVTASTTGALNAWIDFNGDGDWSDAGDHVFIDTTLVAGDNTLTFSVPANAVPGQTFSRWRFSTMRGLSYTGLAPDGEVEDYMLTIKESSILQPPPAEHLKWSQPAVEQDPLSITPVYCGWDEPAYVSKLNDASSATWKLVADDFRCVGDMPVTSVHWWGSYQNWTGSQAPRVVPQSWRIAFWSNIGVDSKYQFSRPGNLLWVVTVPTNRVSEQLVGVDEFPRQSSDACFHYSLQLQPQEYFWQSSYLTSTTDSIFWISITAVYTGTNVPDSPWGWKTRPQPWMDSAVKFDLRQTDLRAGITVDPTTVQLLSNSAVCPQPDAYDMAFELNTDPIYIKWEQAFTGIRDWPHYEDELSVATTAPTGTVKWTQNPDLTTTGVDVDATNDLPPTWPAEIAADDFQCTTAGPITRITVWGSWYRDILPGNDAQNVTFTLSIRQDVPVGQSSARYSMPGKTLWQKQFARGLFTVQSQSSQTESYYNPAVPAFDQSNHRAVYKYVFDIDPREAFQQTGSPAKPTVYWLSVQAQVINAPGTVATRFGWKTSLDHWNDDGTWAQATEPYTGSSWQELRYPSGHPYASRSIDLAFVIETQQTGTGVTYQQVAADDWQCTSNTPVTGVVWWGSYIGYGYQPCDCQQMTPPRQPDYFLLSIWTNVPNPDPTDPRNFSHPGEKIWEYQAVSFDEVMVGFDKHPEKGEPARIGFEPVYRYTVQLPQASYFTQKGDNGVYWLSIVAVYNDPKSMVYPWGWTNHDCTAWKGPAQDPLAYWRFDESSGTVAADSSGNGNDGTVLGSPVWRPTGGRICGALDFSGRGDYVKVAKAQNLNFAPGSFSVSTWVNPREVGGRMQALVEYDRTTFNGNRFGLWIDTNGQFQFRVGSTAWSSRQSLKAGAWFLLTGVYDSSTRQMKLYINGQLDSIGALTGGFVSPVSTKLTIGVRGSEDSEYLNGLLDDMRIYGSALSDQDVLSLFGTGSNDNAVAGALDTTSTWQWTELFDQTGASEDLSFMLFTDPQAIKLDSGGEIVFNSGQNGGVKADGTKK